MKHQIKLKQFFTKQEGIIILGSFSLFGLLGAYISFSDYLSGLFLLLMAFIQGFYIFYRKCKQSFIKVYRITVKDDVPRFLEEYWDKKIVLELNQNYFWSENNKYIPVVFDLGDKITPLYPFNKANPMVTAGHLNRSLVQKATEVLMKPNTSQMGEALKTGGLMILAGGGALIIISLFGELTKTGSPLM